jgi:hypothetical protein
MKKLEYVDELMAEIAHEVPPVRSREHVDSLSQMKITLRTHYEAKRAYYSTEYPDFYDRDLRRLFSGVSHNSRHESAAAFLRRIRPEIRRRVSDWTGEHQYTIDQVLLEMIARSRQLKLRRDRPEREVKQDAAVLLTVQTMNFLHSGHHRVAL